MLYNIFAKTFFNSWRRKIVKKVLYLFVLLLVLTACKDSDDSTKGIKTKAKKKILLKHF